MKKQLLAFAFMSVLILLSAYSCGGEDSDEENEEIPGTVFATYNTGLALGYVSYAPEREPLIGEALAGLEADVICLQEVWTEDSAKALIAAADAGFKYSWYELTLEESTGPGEPACTDEEADPLESCVDEFCSDVDAANITGCVLQNCADAFGALSQECSGCVVANIGKSVDEILAICKEGTEGSAGEFAYEGHNGLLLLSKYELKNPEFKTFESYLNRRVVLNAEITIEDGTRTADVFCTHLTANLSDVNYAGEYDSWAAEQAMQIDGLIAYIDEQTDEEHVAVLMGDLNCGPEMTDVVDELPENYAKFTDAGFIDPYVESEASECTWCAENPLTGNDAVNNVIDHVMFKGVTDGLDYEVKRLFDQPVEIDSDGETVTSRLSDHYGVSVKLPSLYPDISGDSK